MELINHLREYGLNHLTTEFMIRFRRHKTYPQLISLQYDSINSPLQEKVVQQCRGIILDEERNWSIVSYPFDKFFNYAEKNAAKVDWSTAKVHEKLDGSLLILYFNPYSEQWEVATSGSPDASGIVESYQQLTFSQLFWQTWNTLGYQLPQEFNHCFMFELMTFYNRVIVQPKKPSLVLHGVRNLSNLQENSPEVFAAKYGWECVQRFSFSSWADILTASKNLNPFESEGYIICDEQFNRVKVKSPQYVTLSHTKSGFTVKRLVEIIANAESDEVLSYFPEWTAAYQLVQAKYDALIEEIVLAYEALASIEGQKEFASLALQKPYSHILFGLRSGKLSSVKEGLKSMTADKLTDILGVAAII